jgi:hypothetical protein
LINVTEIREAKFGNFGEFLAAQGLQPTTLRVTASAPISVTLMK